MIGELGKLQGFTTRAGGLAALTKNNAIGAWIAVPKVCFYPEDSEDYTSEERKGVWGCAPHAPDDLYSYRDGCLITPVVCFDRNH